MTPRVEHDGVRSATGRPNRPPQQETKLWESVLPSRIPRTSAVRRPPHDRAHLRAPASGALDRATARCWPRCAACPDLRCARYTTSIRTSPSTSRPSARCSSRRGSSCGSTRSSGTTCRRCLKLWFEGCSREGWAYGEGGNALAGKDCLWVTTTGAPEDGLRAQRHSTASRSPHSCRRWSRRRALCAMNWLEPIVVHGAHRIGPDELAASRSHVPQAAPDRTSTRWLSRRSLRDALVYMGAAVICVPLAKRPGLGLGARLPIAGCAIGPWGLGLVQQSESILHFAEFGVVLMLFLIGLELDAEAPARDARRRCSAAAACRWRRAAWAWRRRWQRSACTGRGRSAAGLALAMSSTAIAVQTMTERNLLDRAGRAQRVRGAAVPGHRRDTADRAGAAAWAPPARRDAGWLGAAEAIGAIVGVVRHRPLPHAAR